MATYNEGIPEDWYPGFFLDPRNAWKWMPSAIPGWLPPAMVRTPLATWPESGTAPSGPPKPGLLDGLAEFARPKSFEEKLAQARKYSLIPDSLGGDAKSQPQPAPSSWLTGAQRNGLSTTAWPDAPATKSIVGRDDADLTPEMHRGLLDAYFRYADRKSEPQTVEEPAGESETEESLARSNAPLFLQSGMVVAPPSGHTAPPSLDLSDPWAVAAYRTRQGARPTFGRGDPERTEAAIRAGLVSAADPFGIPSFLIGQVSPATKDLIREQYERHPIPSIIGSLTAAPPRLAVRAFEMAANAAPKLTAGVLGTGGAVLSADEAQGAGRPPIWKAGKSAVDKYWRNVPTELGSPAIRNNNAPLFDYSRLGEVPNVPQFNLERYIPPHGVPERTQKLASPKNIDRVNKIVRQGEKMGGREWHNTEPLRERYVGDLGTREGEAAYKQYFDFLAGSSMRSSIATNIRNASYYYSLARRGEPLPEPALVGGKWLLKEPLPWPYGHPLQGLHAKKVKEVLENGGLSPLENPKAASFSENMRGNHLPVAIDVHNGRLWGVVNTKGEPVLAPGRGEYGFLEGLQQGQAPRFELTPAQYQGSGWLGGGNQTGLRSPQDPFLRVFEQRIAITADRLGLTKEEVLRRFMRGRQELYGIGGAGAGAAIAAQRSPDQ